MQNAKDAARTAGAPAAVTPRASRWLTRVAAFLASSLAAGALAGHCALEAQGLPTDRPLVHGAARADFDRAAIPTVRAATWPEATEMQGFVTAGERLWQMDLARRAARGRLAEWFGADVLAEDRARREEGWPSVIADGYARLPPDEREACDAYAAGVNRFIRDYRHRWGVEYALLRREPEPWLGEDCLAAMAALVQTLGARADDEIDLDPFRSRLPTPWDHFLFPTRDGATKRAPDEALGPCLPARLLAPDELGRHVAKAVRSARGSNAWAVQRGDARLLATDPHLGHSVPAVFYAARGTVADRWFAGVTLPGLPGIVIGMNDSLAWSFTSLEEDNDDYLEVSIDDATRTLRVSDDGARAPYAVAEDSIAVRNEAPVTVTRRVTAHGPVVQRRGRWYLRHWRALEPGSLSVPSVRLNRARTRDELEAALDQFRLPTFHAVFAVRGQGIGYRVVGDRWPDAAHSTRVRTLEATFLEHAAADERVRARWLPAGAAHEHVVSANEAPFGEWSRGHPYDEGGRMRRIGALLDGLAAAPLTARTMTDIQLDTHSAFHRALVTWVAAQAPEPASERDRKMIARWRAWDGLASSDPTTFGEAAVLEGAFRETLLARVREGFQIPADANYTWIQSRLWLRDALEGEGLLACFGVDERDLAVRALEAAVQVRAAGYSYVDANVPEAQHPFEQLPVVGRLFRVRWRGQRGFENLVRFESPDVGPAFRAAFDVEHPERSEWAFPLGQSGHCASDAFDSFLDAWSDGKTMPVFPDGPPTRP